MTKNRCFASVGLVVLAGMSLLARQQSPPVFRTQTDLLTLDVSVLDKNRQPVRGLRASDFVVRVDGQIQEVVAIQEIDVDEAPSFPVEWMRDVTPDVTTNTVGESRVVAIVVDDAMMPLDPRVTHSTKEIVRDVVNRLAPSDYAALVYTADSRKAQDFTHDRTALLAAGERFNGGLASYTFGMETPTNIVNRDLHYYLGSLATLRNVVDLLMTVPERRKTLIWVSPGIPHQASDVSASRSYMGSNLSGQLALEMSQLFGRAQRANVVIYPIDPTGLGGLEGHIHIALVDLMEPQRGTTPDKLAQAMAQDRAAASLDFLETTALNTGGRAIVNTNDFGPGIDSIFQENRSYYLLAIRRVPPKGSGSYRRIEVSVTPPDVEVRTRRGYYEEKEASPEDPKKRNDVSPETAMLANALGGVLPQSGLPLGVTVAPVAVRGERIPAVAVVLRVQQPMGDIASGAKRTETTALQVSAFTPGGDPRGSVKSTAKFTLTGGATRDAIYEVFGRIDLAPGRYALRIAAHNAASAKTGTVTTTVIVPDFATALLSMSGVVVSRSPAHPAAPVNVLAPLFPIVPSAEREFDASDTVDVFVRVYQSGKQAVGPVTLVTRLSSDRGASSVRSRVVAANAFTPTTPTTRQEEAEPMPRFSGVTLPTPSASTPLREASVRERLPLDTLSPGQYLWTIEATMGTTTVRRDVRFSLR